MNLTKLIVVFVSMILLLGVAAYSQVTTATIFGTVADSTGAVIPGATVTLRHVDTGSSRTVSTGADGRYTVSQLSVGSYEVIAESAGFQTIVRTGITLTVGREFVVDFALQVGAVAERITVTGEAPLVETTNATVSGLVNERALRELPLNGRDFTQLMTLQEGVVHIQDANAGENPGIGLGRRINVSGARATANSFLLDGTDIVAPMEQAPASVQGQLLGVETVREFQVITSNASAEYGRAAGAVLNAITKSGTNELHGTAFEFLRNSALDAKNFFDPLGEPIPAFKRNQFGGVLGGPIKKDSMFFFGSYEGLRERLGVTDVANVPTVAARQGNLLGTTISVAPAVVPYLDLYPAVNGREFTNPAGLPTGVGEFLSSTNRATTEDYVMGKFDWQASERDSLFVRYTYDDSIRLDPEPLNLFRTELTTRVQYFTFQESKVFSPTLLNEFRFAFNRTRTTGTSEPIIDIDPALDWVPGVPFGSSGQLAVGGLELVGGIGPLPKIYRQNLWQFTDNMTHTRGSHTLRWGVDYKWIQNNMYSAVFQSGNYRINNLSLFLQGTANQFTSWVKVGTPVRNYRQTIFGTFIQDEWKPLPNLTLNLGLRYELWTHVKELNGRLANLRFLDDPEMTVGDNFENPSFLNFAPRVGIAWDPTGDGKTSIKAGFGVFHEPMMFAVYSHTNLRGPFYVDASAANPPFPNGFDVVKQQPGQPLSEMLRRLNIQSIDFNIDSPTTLQYNFMIQRELTSGMALKAGYVGSHGVHLVRLVNPCVSTPEFLPDGRKRFIPGAPFACKAVLTMAAGRIKTDANSSYNSLQVGVSQRFSRGLQFQVAYTWSRFINDAEGRWDLFGSGALNAQDPVDRGAERALAAGDIRHNFVTNFSYDLPFGTGMSGFGGKVIRGWRLNGILTTRTGNPVTMGIFGSRSGSTPFARFQERPNLAPGMNNNPILGGPDQYYDPNAFELQPQGFYGNLGRNTVIGPGFVGFDFGLVKDTALTERSSLQYRFEAFNLFNRPNFGTPARNAFFGAARAGNAGRISSTVGTSRQIQFALKFIF